MGQYCKAVAAPCDGPYMTIEDHGYGTFALGCGQGSLDCEYSRRVIFFSW